MYLGFFARPSRAEYSVKRRRQPARVQAAALDPDELRGQRARAREHLRGDPGSTSGRRDDVPQEGGPRAN